VREHLVQADQRRGPEAQEADGVRALPGVARLDQRLVEGDVLAARSQARVDDAYGGLSRKSRALRWGELRNDAR
jgi:hypothetical protein